MGSTVLTIFLRLVTSRLAGPVGLGLSIVLGLSLLVAQGQVKARNATIRHQVGQIGLLAQELQQAVGNERALTAAIGRQNAAVAALKRDGDARAQRVQQAAHSAAQGRAAAERRVGAIMAAKPTGDVCKAAVDLIKGRA